MTRQMLSTVSSGRMPRWRATSRRIMSASRAGRKADPTSWVCFTWISRIDDIAALHQQAVDLRIDGVDLFAQHLERGWGGGGDWDIFRPEKSTAKRQARSID